MMRLFMDEAEEAIAAIPADAKGQGTVSVVTAQCAYPFIQDIVDRIQAKVPGGKVQVFCIRNDFFGEHITVTGLLTGRDILNQLRGRDLGDLVLLPGNLLRADAPILLDDVTVDDLKEALQTEIDSVQSSGRDFVHQIVTCLMKER